MFFLFCMCLVDPGSYRVPLDPLELFRADAPMAVSDGGVVWVADLDALRIAVFGADGGFVRYLGGKGQGPGDFQRISSIAWDAVEQVFWVLDPDNARLTRYDAAGRQLDSVKMGDFLNRRMHLRDGILYMVLNNNGTKGEEAYVLQLNPRTGASEKRYVRPPLETTFGLHGKIGRYYVFKNYPWDPRYLFALGREVQVTSFTGSTHVDVHRTNGKTRRLEVVFDPVPLLPATVADTLDRSHAPDLAAQAKKIYQAPKRWTNHVAVRVDEHDHIWVFGAPTTDGTGYPYRVFSPEGQQVHEGRLAHLPEVLYFGAAYGLTEAEDGVFLWRMPVTVPAR